MKPEDLVTFLIEKGSRWVHSERDVHRPSARALLEAEISGFAQFFDNETLDRARVKIVPVIENPGFSSILRNIGIRVPLDFTAMSGITFVDTILISRLRMPAESQFLPLLFHEMVHIVQYEVLGLRMFVDRYVRGWAENEFNYFAIPLERDAYELQARYEVDPHLRFSVTGEVRQRVASY